MAGIRPYFPPILFLLGLAGPVSGQVSLPPANLVTIPTAGTAQRGQFEVELLMQRGGGVLGRLGVGFSDRFSLGLSYGVQNFIGDDSISFQPLPEAQLKYGLYNEGYTMPAIAIGLDSQGRGEFREAKIDSANGIFDIAMARYDVKAIGIYLVVSKNWQILGNFGSHLGLSKNVWESDQIEDDFNLFLGFDKDIAPGISLFLEYNAALDDNDYDDDLTAASLGSLTVGQGRGYLNAAIRWHIASSFYMEVDLNDIMLNKGNVKYFSRELKVVYNEFF